MEFVTDDATVQCIRIVPGHEGSHDTRVVVATFDAAVENDRPSRSSQAQRDRNSRIGTLAGRSGTASRRIE